MLSRCGGQVRSAVVDVSYGRTTSLRIGIVSKGHREEDPFIFGTVVSKDLEGSILYFMAIHRRILEAG